MWYWTFYPFNYGKPVGPFGVLGNRELYLATLEMLALIADVGDWEYLRLRTINGSAVSVDYRE